jgi:hypothetical protein
MTDQQPAYRPTMLAEPLVQPLLSLGYPSDMVWDAALRLSWAPEVGDDLIAYAAAAASGAGAGPGHPSSLRLLPGGFTVARLMAGYGFGPTGAFLMAQALVTHTDEALAVLERLLSEGRYTLGPDGSYRHEIVPEAVAADAAAAAAAGPGAAAGEAAAAPGFCMGCGAALTPGDAFCAACGRPAGA